MEKLSYARSIANDMEVINKYFDLLEQTFFENNISDFPGQNFNCDETGLPLDHTPSSVVAVRGAKTSKSCYIRQQKADFSLSMLQCS